MHSYGEFHSRCVQYSSKHYHIHILLCFNECGDFEIFSSLPIWGCTPSATVSVVTLCCLLLQLSSVHTFTWLCCDRAIVSSNARGCVSAFSPFQCGLPCFCRSRGKHLPEMAHLALGHVCRHHLRCKNAVGCRQWLVCYQRRSELSYIQHRWGSHIFSISH